MNHRQIQFIQKGKEVRKSRRVIREKVGGSFLLMKPNQEDQPREKKEEKKRGCEWKLLC